MGSVGHKISMELDVDYTNTKSELGISKYMYYSFLFFYNTIFCFYNRSKENYIKYSSKSHDHKCYFGIHIYLCTNAIIYIRCIVTDRVCPKLDCTQNIPKNEFYEKHCDCSTML